ncbi:nickel pincer cofactor biosynthesis protein LarC [Liquorilactobacillus uvarum]|uniref:nickel pincer cofactor biosynthesis protein LarC n=1 Tax=Liquorilactobacillus uvarum TaxID=303240 RepID=UPI00288B979D|nr:nickel pincer cofactor biosynthesis protein LarC [Liquorilactobacillus uvarum]
MKTLVLDAFSGISGDMFLGAMFDLGLSQSEFEEQLNKLKVPGYQIVVERTARSSITGTDFDVVLDGNLPKDQGFDEHQHHHHHGRNFMMIKQLILQSNLKTAVKEKAVKMFEQIALAEAKVHGKKLEDVHFHEVGALDSIVDIVGAAIAFDMLQLDKLVVNNLSDGVGTIKIAHGIVPVPVPAVMEMQLNTAIPIQKRFDVHTELITPTGMAIIKCMGNEFNTSVTNGVLERTGYGFGKRETGSLNALRASLYNSKLSQQQIDETNDRVLLMETNLDDATGQQLSITIKNALELGAKDAWAEPIIMKKGRPAYKLCLLTAAEQQETFVKFLFSDTPAIGLRLKSMHREIMERRIEQVQTSYGKFGIKRLSYCGLNKFSVEYDDIEKCSQKTGKSFEEIKLAVLQEIENKGV